MAVTGPNWPSLNRFHFVWDDDTLAVLVGIEESPARICEWLNRVSFRTFRAFSFLSSNICFPSLAYLSLVYPILRWRGPLNHLLFLLLPNMTTCWKDYSKLSCTKLEILISYCLALPRIMSVCWFNLVESQVLRAAFWFNFVLKSTFPSLGVPGRCQFQSCILQVPAVPVWMLNPSFQPLEPASLSIVQDTLVYRYCGLPFFWAWL